MILRIDMKGKDMDELFKIEKQLRKLGVSFDTGYDLVNHKRDWMLDWSLKGAEVVESRIE